MRRRWRWPHNGTGTDGNASRRPRDAATIVESIPGVPQRCRQQDDVREKGYRQTRFHWLRSAPDAPGAASLVGLTERIAYLRTLEIDPRLQARIPSGRWDQMVREGDATPAWLASDFNASRGHATIVAQIIKLGQKLTDDAVMMFIKLMGRLFSQANNRKKQRHMSTRLETSKALRLFLDTILALVNVPIDPQ